MFVCLGFGHFILFLFRPRSSKGPRMGRFFLGREAQNFFFLASANGRQFFKNVDFSVTYPLKGV